MEMFIRPKLLFRTRPGGGGGGGGSENSDTCGQGGRGGKNGRKIADVLYGCPLMNL